jgi:hypothetical protein
MCDYCDAKMYRESSTSEKRLEYRLRVFETECRKDVLGLFKRGSVADAIDEILMCEKKDSEREVQVRREIMEMVMGHDY